MFANIHLFEGPGLLAPFPAVMAEAECPRQPLADDTAEGHLRQLLPPLLLQHLRLPLPDHRFETVAAAVANAIQDSFGANDLPVVTERIGAGRCRILLGYVDAGATTLALRTALDLTAALFALVAGQPADTNRLTANLQHALQQMQLRQPDPLARQLINQARARGIPVTPLAPGSRVWQFGQGVRGIHFFEAANHFDSLTGARLARNKFQSNQLILRLGLPGTRHALARSPAAAVRLAREIGYPVVVKPVAGGKGAGITVHVTTDQAVETAFAVANQINPGEVLIERFIAGDDHRLVVIDGRFAWGVQRTPAAVTGDGTHSIGELITIENRRRAALPAADIAAAPLALDADMLAVLRGDDRHPDDIPGAGVRVALRRMANVSRGGTLSDCSDRIHPHNRDMAEAIARSFHIDVMGLDFMTPDISRSWRDVDCAVLEVNATPGFSSPGRAGIILNAKFPDGGDGRIPAVVLVGASADAVARVAGHCAASGLRVGLTDGQATFMAGEPRLKGQASLPVRVNALTLDAGCEALVIATTPTELERHGFPLAHCDLVLLGADLTIAMPLRQLVERCADTVHRLAEDGMPDAAASAAIQSALQRRTNGSHTTKARE
jgi:cyanophycin synthetase